MSLQVSIGTIADIASTAKSPAPAYLPALTGLRFVLALWVVLHHISGKDMMLESFVATLHGGVHTMVRGGYLAVQTFFVLSGFVLAQNYADQNWNVEKLKQYFIARFARIYPVYFFSLLVVSKFIVDALFRPTRTLEKKISLIVDYVFLLQGWKGNLGVGWNTPAWTLSCEVFFYLCFPLLLPFIGRAGKWTLAGVIVLTTIIPPILPYFGIPYQWKPLFHVSDFAAGIATSRIFDLSKDRFNGRGIWLYLPALVVGVFLIMNPELTWRLKGDLNAGLRPLNVAVLLGLAWGGGMLARWLSTRSMDLLGKASYSLYILHVPILWWFSKWAMRRDVGLPRFGASAIYLVLIIGASIATFLYVETPMNRWIRKSFGMRRRTQPHPYVTAP